MKVLDTGLLLAGTIPNAEEHLPVRVEDEVLTDEAGDTTVVRVRGLRGFEERTIALGRDTERNWPVNGVVTPALRGCADVDLGCSPATNTLPIRRLRLAVGASATISAAMVEFHQLTVVPLVQTYQRLDRYTYRYSSANFAAELTVDDDGLVTEHDEGRVTGVAVAGEEH